MLSRCLRDRRDGKPSTPPPEERKQPALLMPLMTLRTYAAAAAGAPLTAPGGSDMTATTASPRTIAAVQAADDLEEDCSLAVDNSFLERDSKDLPGSATAPSTQLHPSDRSRQLLDSPRLTTRISDVVLKSFQGDNMPLADIIRQEFAPTATSVHQMEASARNTVCRRN